MASKGEELWKKYKSGGDSDITPSSSASTTSTKNNAVERWNKWKQDNSTLGSRVQESGSDLFDRYNHVIERASGLNQFYKNWRGTSDREKYRASYGDMEALKGELSSLLETDLTFLDRGQVQEMLDNVSIISDALSQYEEYYSQGETAEEFQYALEQKLPWYQRSDRLRDARNRMEASEGKSDYQILQEDIMAEDRRLAEKWQGSHQQIGSTYLTGSGGYNAPLNEHYNNVGQAYLEDRKDLDELLEEKHWMDYVQKYTGKEFEDDFLGQTSANYTMGRLSQDSSLAWNAYLENPTDANRRDAETIDQLMTEIQWNNQDVYADDGKLPWLSKTLANYIPQFLDQMKYSGSFGAAGALTGNAQGVKAGMVLGSGAYSYMTMRGAAFKSLLEAGVPEEQARAAAKDEAVVSSLIEMGDTAIDLATLGGGKLINVLSAGSVDAIKNQIAKSVGKNVLTKLAAALANYGINIGSEWLEEATQESVSIANQNNPDGGIPGLVKDAAGVFFGSVLDSESEEGQQIREAGAEGAKIAAMMGGIQGITNAATERVSTNYQAKQAYGPYSQELIQEAKILNPDSQLAEKLQGQIDSKKDLTGRQIVNLVRENQNAFEKQVNPETTLEEASQKYGSQAEAMESIYRMGNGKQEVGKFDRAYKLAYEMGKNGVRLEYVMQSPSTQYLTETQRAFAYQTGQFAAKNQEQTSNVDANQVAQTKGTRYNEAKQAAQKYGDQGQVFLDSRQDNQDLVQYDKGFQFAYNMGMNGGSLERVMDSPHAQYLTEDQKQIAYQAGQAAQQAQVVAVNQGMRGKFNGREETGIRLRQGVQRSDGQNPGGQVRSVEGGAGSLQVRKEETPGQSRTGGSAAQETSGRVSARDLGLPTGSARKNLTLVSDEDSTPDIQKARAVAKEKGMDIVLFKGGSMEVTQNGKSFAARGVVSGNTMYIRADQGEFTAEQLARHEAAHRDIAQGNLPRASEIYDRLVEKYGKSGEVELPDGSVRDTSEFIDWVIEQYAEAYSMTNYTADEVFEEIVCDSMADMNAFGEDMKPIVEHFLKDIKAQAEQMGGSQSVETTGPGEVKFSREKAKAEPKRYSYEWFIQKPDMVVTTIGDPVTMSRADIINEAKKNAVTVGKGDSNGTVTVHVRDTDMDVIIGRDGLKHSIDRRLKELGPIILKAGEILQNSIKINELLPKKADAVGSYVLIGAARNPNGDFYVVRSVVNRFQSKLVSMDVLYAINAKKEAAAQNVQTASEDAAALNAPIFTGNPLYVTAPTISISELLENVNAHFPDVLPEDVLKHFGHDRRPDGVLGESALYSREDPTVAELQRENALLKERLEYWKGQVKRTDRKTVRVADVDKAAKSILSEYQSKAEFGDVLGAMKSLADKIVDYRPEEYETTDNRSFGIDEIMSEDSIGISAENAFWDQVKQDARDIARDIVQKSQVMTNEFEMETFKDIKAYLRSVKISLGSARADIPDFNNFRKRNFGRFTLSKEGVPMDSLWLDLQDQFGKGFFPEEIVHPADQIQHIEGLYAAMEPDYANPYQGEIGQNVEACANEILDVLFSDAVRQTAKTFADRQWEKLAEYDQKIKQSRDKIKELRQEKKNIRQSYIQARKESAEGRKKARIQGTIERKAKGLSDKLVKNSDKEHIPEVLKKTVGDFLTSIDFSSNRKLKGGKITQKDISYSERLDRLRQILQNQADYMNAPEHGTDNGFYLDLPSGFTELVQKHINDVRDAAASMNPGENPLRRMSVQQLQDMDHILTVMGTSIREMNKLLANAHFQTAMEASRATIQDLGQLGEKSRAGKVQRFLEWDNTTPYYAFKRLGEAPMSIFEGIQDGWDKMAMNVIKVVDYSKSVYKPEEVRAWSKDIREVQLSSGETMKISIPQAMSLYCLMKREQAMKHLKGGGLRIGNIEVTGKKPITQTDNFKVTLEDLDKITNLLAPRQREVADKLQLYMNTQGSAWGNEVSMKRFGYRSFTESNYFPIQSDSNVLPAVHPDAQANDLFRLLNMAMTKGLNPKANNALVVSNIFDVFADHMSDMAKYNALALPILDTMKWYNFKDQRTDPVSKQITTATVQKSIEKAFSRNANSYIVNFIKDLNGIQDGGKGTDSLSRKMISNYKVAAVAGNLRVAILQPTAYVRATAVMNPKYLAMAMKGNPVKLAAEAEKYSGIAAWKAMGFYDTNISRGIREQIKNDVGKMDKFVELTMTGAEWGDRLTWGYLWYACKMEVHDNTNLTGEALNAATAKRFRDVVYRTQVVDSTMTRSQSMRDTKGIGVYTTAFMADPTLSYNMLLDAYASYEGEVRRTGSKAKAWKRFGRSIARAMIAYTAANFAAALAESVMDGLRDDDEYETFLEKFWEHFGENFWQDMNPLTKLPFVKDVLSYLDGYDNTRLDTEWAANLVKSLELWQDKKGGSTLYGNLYNSLKAVSQITGLPISNMLREVATIWNNTFGVLTGQKLKTYDAGPMADIKYAYLDGYLTEAEATQELMSKGLVDNENEAYWKIREWDADGEYSRYDSLYQAARNGQSIQQAMEEFTSHGYTEKEVLSKLKSQIGIWYEGGEISKQQAVDMLEKYMDMDSQSIDATVNKWSSKVVTGIAFEDIKEEFLSGNLTASRAAEMYVRYGGYTEEDAQATVKGWQFEQEWGFAYSQRKSAYKSGQITDSELRTILMDMGGKTAEEAEQDIAVYDWEMEVPGSDGISYAAIRDYYESVEPYGVTKGTYTKAWKIKNSAKGVDADGDGKKDAYSVVKEVFPQIAALPISSEQKDALAHCWWSDSTVRKYKTW